MKAISVIAVSILALLAAAPRGFAQEAYDQPAYDQPVPNQPYPESAPSDLAAGGGGYGASSQAAPKYDKFNWEGRYIGGFAGVGTGVVQQSDPTGLQSEKADLSGLVFGGAMGNNWQYSAMLIGMETDFTLSQMSSKFTIPAASWGCNDISDNCTTDINWYATSRLRAGVAIDNVLPYVTAGVAVASVDSKYSGSPLVEDTSGIAFGYVLGAGLEYGVTEHFTVKGEALYVDLGNPVNLFSESSFKVNSSFAVVRAGANFKF